MKKNLNMASTSTSSTICLATPSTFMGENYDYWAVKMRLFFKENDLWEIIENDFEPKKRRGAIHISSIKVAKRE